MYVDQNHEGLKVYRAHRAEKRVLWELAMDYAEEHPEATPAKCKAAALAIREEQLKAEAEKPKANQKKKQRPKKQLGKQPVNMSNVRVTVVNKVE